ncbi:hypothetical protein HAX54_052488 [Datura stramonium]|uniref:Uncharacterized protein n=1 Tax=Datura stramonium TaxID=4076 RepID=A0ABS8SZP8_DATST|nr:hypothetical protein [Datura stramonium]
MATILSTNPLIRLFPSNSQRYSCYLHRTMKIGQSIHIQTSYQISFMSFLQFRKRRNFICAVSKDAEESFKKDRGHSIACDILLVQKALGNVVVNPSEAAGVVSSPFISISCLLSLNWGMQQEQTPANPAMTKHEKDYEELALTVMGIVDRLVHKTNEKIEASTSVLKAILKPVVDEVEEIASS